MAAKKGGVLSTGTYDMKMLNKLSKMEEEFKEKLSQLWGVEDEDDLPDSLGELDFNDIMSQGETLEERREWLISVIKAAEGFDASKDAPATALAAETAEAIQKLEDSYK